MVSACVPSHFNWTLPTQTATMRSHLRYLKVTGVTEGTVLTEHKTEGRKGQGRHVNKDGNEKKVDEE